MNAYRMYYTADPNDFGRDWAVGEPYATVSSSKEFNWAKDAAEAATPGCIQIFVLIDKNGWRVDPCELK